MCFLHGRSCGLPVGPPLPETGGRSLYRGCVGGVRAALSGKGRKAACGGTGEQKMSKFGRALAAACFLAVFACAAYLACGFAVNGAEIVGDVRAHSAQVRSDPLFLSSREGEPLSVSIEGAEDWTYGDGEKKVSVSPLAEGAAPAYLYTGETEAGALYESAVQPADAGCYTLTVTAAGEDGAVAAGTCAFTIRKRPLGVVFEEVSAYTYTGSPVYPQFSDDRLEGDDLQFEVTAENAFGQPCDPVAVGAGYRARVQLAGGADAANYSFAGAESAPYAIGPAELTVHIDEETAAEYTGRPIDIEKASNASAVAVCAEDEPEWEFSLSPWGSAGWKRITSLKDVSDSGTVYWHVSAPNHTSRTGEISFTIRQAENSFLLGYARENWHYGESAGAETAPAPKFGGQTMQTLYFTAAGEPYAESFGPLTPAGRYYALVTVEGTENYTALSEKFYFTVERAPLSLRADGTAVYGDGAEEIAYSVSASGLKNGETPYGLLSAAGLELSPRALSASGAAYGAGSPAGEYGVYLDGSFAADALANYEVTFAAGTLRVDRFPLTASLQPAFTSRVYDGAEKGYTASLSAGAFGEEVEAVLAYSGAEGTLPGAPSDAGSYTVTLALSAADAQNYALGGETCAQFEVLLRTLGVDCGDGIVLSVEWTEQCSYVYDGTDKTSLVRAWFSPFGGGKAALAVSPAAGQGAFRDVRAGGYLFEAVGFADASLARNYALPEGALRQAAFFIERREVCIAVPGGSALFADEIPALGWEYAGASAYLEEARFLPEDGIRFSVTTDAARGSAVGEYAAYISACTGGQGRLFNYTVNGGEGFASARGVFAVLPAPIDTAGTAGFSAVYDGTVHLFAEEAALSASVRGGREGSVRWQFFIDGGADTGIYCLAEGVCGAGTYTVRYTVTAQDHAPAEGTFTVTVGRASNGWEVLPADVGRTYGEDADLSALFGRAKFGQVRAEYYTSRSGAGTAGDPFVYGGAVPASDLGAYAPAGTYYVRLSVEGTADYAGLEGGAVMAVARRPVALPSFAGGEREISSVYGGRWADGFGCDVLGISVGDPSLLSVSCTGGSLLLSGGELYFLSAGAGEHAVTFSLTDENHCWQGADGTDAVLCWYVAPACYDLNGIGYAEAYEYVYDGQAHLPALSRLPQGKDGVPVSVRYEGGGRDAGEGDACAVLTSESPNYIFAGGEARFYTRVRILPRPVQAVWVLPEGGFTYNGEVQHSAEDPAIRAYYTDVNGRAVELFVGKSADGPFCDWREGGYLFAVSCADANYALGGGSVRVEMARSPLTVAAEDKQAVFGGEEVPLTYTVQGELYGQTICVFLSREEGKGAGAYAVSVSVSGAENFEVTAVGGVYTVLPAPSSLRAEMEGWTYGEEAKPPRVFGAAGEVTLRYTGTSNGGKEWDGALPPTEAGEYVLTVSDAGSADVRGGSVRIPFTVARARISVPAPGGSGARTLSEPYSGGAGAVLLSGFDPTVMSVAGVPVRAEGEEFFLVAEGAGTYTVRIRLLDTDNFVWEGGEELVFVWRAEPSAEEDAWLAGVAATFAAAGAGALGGAFFLGKMRGRRRP